MTDLRGQGVSLRSLIAAMVLATVASACGIYANVGGEDAACDLKPVSARVSGLAIGPQKVAASCASAVEVNGRKYSVGVGRWLDEDALLLEQYGTITRANTVVTDPTAYALRGIDPLQFLVMRGDGSADDLGEMGPYMVLWGGVMQVPQSMCRYADPADAQYPSESCPLTTGRTYSVEMIVACGLQVPVGPYGGEYWLVVDPPTPLAGGERYPGMYQDIDYGKLELLDADSAVYRSERGAELALRRITDGSVTAADMCDRP